MSTETRLGIVKSVIEVFKSLANKETIDSAEDIEWMMINPDFIKAWDNIENGNLKKEVENPTNVTGGSKKGKGGFATKINPIKDAKTEKAMRDTHKKVQEELEHGERE